MGNRITFLLLAALACPPGCKPDRPVITEYRVSLREALRVESATGLEPGQEDETVAKIGADEVALGELVRAVRALPPFARYYYSSPDKALVFLQNYVLMNLCAREAVREGMADDPRVRMDLLVALEAQIRADLLADRVRTDAGAGDLEQRREDVWKRHLQTLREAATVTVDRDRVRALAAGLPK